MAFTPGHEQTLAVRVESEGVDAFTGQMDDAIGAVGKFRTAVGLAGGALAALSVGAMAKATSAAADFETAMAEVQKVTDATTAAQLNGEIREMAETIPLAQAELAGLTADAARFGIRGTENITAFTESTARMATATNLSAQEAGESLARLSTLTDTPAREIENLGSSINTLSNNFATSSDEIVDSMLRSSAALSQFGLGRTEIVGLSAALNEVSESSQRAGTRLRRVGQELMDPRKAQEVAAALGMTNEEFRRMRREDPAALIVRMAESFKRGGTAADELRTTLSTASRQAVAGLAQNLDATRQAMDMANRSYREGTSLQREFAVQADTFNAKLQTTKNRLRNVAITTGEATLPAMNDLLGAANEAISDFQKLNKATDGMAGQMAAATIALGGLGATVAWFTGGPMAAMTLGAGALGAAWASNLFDIQGIAARTMTETGDILGRTLNAMTDETNRELGKQFTLWDHFAVRTTAGLDTIGVSLLNLLDVLLTGMTIVQEFGQTWGEVWYNIATGQFKKAKDEAVEGVDEVIRRTRESMNAMERRSEALMDRNRQRDIAIDSRNTALLPKNLQSDGPDALDQAAAKNQQAAQAAQAAAAQYARSASETRKAAEQMATSASTAAAGAGGAARPGRASAGGTPLMFPHQAPKGDGRAANIMRELKRQELPGETPFQITQSEWQKSLETSRQQLQATKKMARRILDREGKEATDQRVMDVVKQIWSARRGNLPAGKGSAGGGKGLASAPMGVRRAVAKDAGMTAAATDAAAKQSERISTAVQKGATKGFSRVAKTLPQTEVVVRHQLPNGDSVLEQFIRETVRVEVESENTRVDRKLERIAERGA